MELGQISAHQVSLSHGKTFYLETGQGGAPLILLHGVGFWTGGDYWTPNLNELGRDFHVYAPDFVGWGEGDRLPVEYSFAYLVDFVREFQDALGISSAHIVGHSMGGWVASLLAYESPQRVRSLVLVASGGLSTRTLSAMTAFTPPSREDIVRHLTDTVHSDRVDISTLANQGYARTQLPDAVEAYTKILVHMNNPAHRARYNIQRRLPYISSPALVIWGTKDPVNDLAMGERMQELIPHSEFVTMPCGHYCPSEMPELFDKHVIQFLQTHTEPRNEPRNELTDEHVETQSIPTI